MPRKIFLLASTSFEMMCQWPQVTPASLNGEGCAAAGFAPSASSKAANAVVVRAVFMDVSLCEFCHLQLTCNCRREARRRRERVEARIVTLSGYAGRSLLRDARAVR